jgi:Flp pilus assembly protein TadG
MFGVSFRNQLRGVGTRFIRADRGNIAVTFAIALVPIIGFIGAAVDYSRATRARSSMQAALDSTALMLSRDLSQGLISASDVDAKAGTYFKALYTDPEATVNTADVHGSYTAKDSSGAQNILVTGKGSVDTQFMKVAGFPKLNFDSNSTAKWGNARMRVAMVLDVTGSMDDDNKMSNMQSAAKSMIDTLSNLNKTAGDVYISIVPFSRDVNIGPTSDAAAWVTGWPAWEAEPASIKTNKPANWKNYGPDSSCPFDNQSFGCVTTPVSGSPSTNSIPSNAPYSGYICPGVDGGTANYYNGCYDSKYLNTTSDVELCTGKNCTCNNSAAIGGKNSSCNCSGSGKNTVCTETLRNYSHTWIVNDHSTWNGCVIDRDQDYDTTNDEPKLGVAATQFVVEQYSSCPLPLTPMSNKWSTLKDTITKLTPAGNTNQAIGAAWGWFSLSQTAPLKAPAKETGYAYNDYVVLVSDGLNTQDRWYSDAASIDARQMLLCDNLKKTPYNVKVFAIQINTSTKKPDPTSAVLQYCASGADNFQMITSADQTAAAFQKVTTQLSKLRVAK